MSTICGVPLDAFKEAPRPQELAAVVARWASDNQSEFFAYLADELKNCCGGFKEEMQINYIARDLKALEDELCDGGGSSLIKRLAGHVHNYQTDEELA